jgi:hypothetical protein
MEDGILFGAFALGVAIAERVHGVSQSAHNGELQGMVDLLRQVAEGRQTLLANVEETVAGMGDLPAHLEEKLPPMLWRAAQEGQQIAQGVLTALERSRNYFGGG